QVSETHELHSVLLFGSEIGSHPIVDASPLKSTRAIGPTPLARKRAVGLGRDPRPDGLKKTSAMALRRRRRAGSRPPARVDRPRVAREDLLPVRRAEAAGVDVTLGVVEVVPGLRIDA